MDPHFYFSHTLTQSQSIINTFIPWHTNQINPKRQYDKQKQKIIMFMYLILIIGPKQLFHCQKLWVTKIMSTVWDPSMTQELVGSMAKRTDSTSKQMIACTYYIWTVKEFSLCTHSSLLLSTSRTLVIIMWEFPISTFGKKNMHFKTLKLSIQQFQQLPPTLFAWNAKVNEVMGPQSVPPWATFKSVQTSFSHL